MGEEMPELMGFFAAVAPSASQAVMLFVAVAGLLLVLASALRTRRAARRESSSYRFEPRGTKSEETAALRDIDEAMVRLDDLARRVHGRLDAKLATLEQLIREADGCIDRLSRAVRMTDASSALDVTLPAEDPCDPAAHLQRRLQLLIRGRWPAR